MAIDRIGEGEQLQFSFTEAAQKVRGANSNSSRFGELNRNSHL